MEGGHNVPPYPWGAPKKPILNMVNVLIKKYISSTQNGKPISKVNMDFLKGFGCVKRNILASVSHIKQLNKRGLL